MALRLEPPEPAGGLVTGPSGPVDPGLTVRRGGGAPATAAPARRLTLSASEWAALVTGRMPDGMRDFGAFSVRYLAQTLAYALVLTDRYPHAGPALPREPEPRPLFDPWETAR